MQEDSKASCPAEGSASTPTHAAWETNEIESTSGSWKTTMQLPSLKPGG